MLTSRANQALFAIVIGLGGLLYLLWSYGTVGDLRARVETLDVEETQACVVEIGGTVACWGERISSTLNTERDDGFWRQEGPVRADGLDDAVDVAVARGGFSACAVATSQRVSCWGWIDGFVTADQLSRIDFGAGGDLGLTRGKPVELDGLSSVVELFGGHSMCARHSDGTVSCGGDLSDEGFVAVPALDGARSVHPGRHTWCALFEDATVRCIDREDQSRINTPFTGVASFQVAGSLGGEEYHCVIFLDGDTQCFGATCGRLADCTYFGDAVSTRLGGASIVFEAGEELCGSTDGRLRCVPGERSGSTQEATFVERSEVGVVVAASSSAEMACVANRDNQVHCWGEGEKWTTDGLFGVNPNDGPRVVPMSFVPLRQRLVWFGLFGGLALLGLWTRFAGPKHQPEE